MENFGTEVIAGDVTQVLSIKSPAIVIMMLRHNTFFPHLSQHIGDIPLFSITGGKFCF
jgi:hypothetical protein